MKTYSINRISLAATAVLFAVVLYSCQKENSLNNSATTVTEEQATVYSDESAQTEASFDDVEDVSMTAAEEEGTVSEGGRAEGDSIRLHLTFEELRLRIGHCADITVTPNDSTYPKKITIDFGDGCIGPDGKFRKGAIILYYTKPLRRPGAELTITLRNFYVNRAHIEGTKIIKNLTEGNVHKFSVVVNDGKVTWPNGRGFKYEKIKVVTQVGGMDTRRIRDDVYSIEGRSKTSYANGTTVVLNTETPLIKPVACNWIVSGVLKIKINNRTLFLDFGNGQCDNKALLKWNDRVVEITLP